MPVKLTNTIQRAILLLPGWHTNRKLIIIESDDWGCARVSNKQNLRKLSEKLPHILEDPYNRLDSLESKEDLEALFDILNSVRDKNNKSAIITANFIMANPDFRKIKQNGFQSYYYEPFTETIKRIHEGVDVLKIYKEGMAASLFIPQLHGREHVNITQWLNALKMGHSELLDAFNYEMFSINLKQKINMRNNVMAALDINEVSDFNQQIEIINDSQKLFELIFGNKSITFIAPSYIWQPSIEPALYSVGIKAMQGLTFQYIPNPGGKWYKTKFRFTGRKTNSGLMHLVRNCFFEPSLSPGNDIVNECLKRIELAFEMKKPAIIGSHRLNFMGGLEISNREKNLRLLEKLLNEIVRKWPDAEFMSSPQLIQLINKERDRV
jgi:hypothetical protein